MRNAKGPFRNSFRALVDDPDDFDKLRFDKVLAKWTSWRDRFERHYQLTPEQKAQLQKVFTETVAKLKEHLTSREIAGEVREKYKGTIDYKIVGEVEQYERLVQRYNSKLQDVRQDFQQEHLDKIWSELESKRKELTAPVNEWTESLEKSASNLLSVNQLTKVPPPRAPSKVDAINFRTIWGLTILGICLITGLFTRTAACGAAVLLMLFYLAVPPWPGVPEAPGPEHSLIVNKNLIEVIACLAVACLPSGRWFGLDALIHRFILRQTND